MIALLRPGLRRYRTRSALNGRDEEAENVCDVLDALGVTRTALVGHSLGGWLAATVAARFPNRVSALVLGAPFGLDVPEHRGADMSSMTPPEIAATLTNDPSIWEGRLPAGPDPAFEAARGRERQALMRFMPGPYDPELPGILAKVSAPTLLLWGEDDKVAPVGLASTGRRRSLRRRCGCSPARAICSFMSAPTPSRRSGSLCIRAGMTRDCTP